MLFKLVRLDAYTMIGGAMNNIEKYKILSEGMPFVPRAKIAIALLDSEAAYEELKEEASKTSVPSGYGYIGGFPENILEMLVSEIICREVWYLPDKAKILDRRFGSLFVNKFFCYDDDEEIWSKVLHRYFLELEWMPKKRTIALQGAITKLGNILESF